MAIKTPNELKAAREAKGLTQDMLAKMAGVSSRSVHRAETEGVSAETLRCIAAALNEAVEISPDRQEDPVERRRRTLNTPASPGYFAFCVGFCALCVAVPVLIACMVNYHHFYATLKSGSPGLAKLVIFLQGFGLPALLAAACYYDARFDGKRTPTVGAVLASNWTFGMVSSVALVVMGMELPDAETARAAGETGKFALAWFKDPLVIFATLLIAYVTIRSFPSTELRYVAWREKALYGGRTAR